MTVKDPGVVVKIRRAQSGSITAADARRAVRAVASGVQPPTPATLKRYGLSASEWLAILRRQGGVCAICKKVPGPAKNTGLIRFVIDHEHVRGWKRMSPDKRKLYVRGLTCWWCNSSYLGRSITADKARNVARYLDAHAKRLAKAIAHG